MRSDNSRGQMEMSVGTIVTIVLLVTLLILGVVLIKNIFTVAKGTVDLTEQQMRNEINKLFADDKEVVIFPGTRLVEIKQGTSDGVLLGIKNLGNDKDEYSYSTRAEIGKNCPSSFTEQKAMDLIILGETGDKIILESGGDTYKRISFEIPVSTPLCTIGYSVAVTSQNERNFDESFEIHIKAK
ncbi:MAG: hypothetical protein AABW47_00575 [Nanoarchaeota archaeon]